MGYNGKGAHLIVVSGPAGSGKTTLAHASLEVDTADGYRPGLDQIVAFAGG